MPLLELPPELLEMVPKNLTDHKDFMSFMLVCRATYHIVDHQHRVWRELAYHHFDIPESKTGKELKGIYQYRQKVLFRNIGFNCGYTTQELESVRLLRDLISESFASHESSVPKSYSKNLDTLKSFVQRSSILTNVLRYDPHITRWLKTIQVVFAPWSLEYWQNCPNWSFPDSQRAAYTHPETSPMFQEGVTEESMTEVDMDLVLHISNFFKRHLTESTENTLFIDFTELRKSERPAMWQSQIHPGLKELGSFWKGTFAYVDPDTIEDLRNTELGTESFIDMFHETDDFPYLELDFHPLDHNPWWPRGFEIKLHGLPSPQLVRELNDLSSGSTTGIPTNVNPPTIPGLSFTRPGAHNGVHYLQFTGEGQYQIKPSKFHCSGILHPLPPQYGVPGWQRIIMVKCHEKSHTCPHPTADPNSPASSSSAPPPGPIYPTVLRDCCWAYEGVVLPGGTMIFGRWWSPTETEGERLVTGPFIYWNVPRNIVETEDEDEEEVVVGKGKGRARR